MSLPRILGITGYAQHGKDTIASVFVEEAGYQRVGLADIMKQALLVLDPYIEFPDTDIPVRLSDRMADGETMVSVGHYANAWEYVKEEPEVRRLLQVFGTEVGRNMLGENIWIEALAKSIHGFYDDHGPRIVIPDIRFLNEAAFIRRMRGEVYRVVRPDFDNGVGLGHASEREIASIYHDERFANDQDVEYLKAAVRRYIEAREQYPYVEDAKTFNTRYSTGEYAEFA